MLCYFAMLVGGQGSGAQTPFVLAQHGSTLSRVAGAPGSVAASKWQYRLYSAEIPAYGPLYWGIVEGNSLLDTRSELVRMRKQQATWWGWLGRIGRPEPMAFTSFNALGPIGLLDDAAWSDSWKALGPGAAKEVSARERRLAAARPLENSLYRMFDNRTWSALFEGALFRNAGLNLYQGPWVALAMTRLRAFETEMRSASPMSVIAVNNDLAAFRKIAKHLRDAADDLAKRQGNGGASPIASAADALNFLNSKLSSYPVRAGEGGPGSGEGNLGFQFSATGFQLSSTPPGWYGGNEAVAYATIDPISVRYDPFFGGLYRGGVVFLPKDNLRPGYRGPAGILLPLGTTPGDAETLARALRRLVKEANGLKVDESTSDPGQMLEADDTTANLVKRLHEVADGLDGLGIMAFRNEEIGARVPAPLAAAIARRDRLWRDSEIAQVLQSQLAPGARVSGGLAAMSTHLGIPMGVVPLDPPIWRVAQFHDRGSVAVAIVREACTAKVAKTGRAVTVSRLVEETWSNPQGNPRLVAMKLIDSRQVDTPVASTATGLAHRFFNLGSHYLDRNRLSEAESSLRRAISLRPDWATAWNWLSVVVVRQGRVAEAAPICEQATLLNPKYVLALSNFADIRRVQGRIDDSLALAKRASGLAPNDAWARVVLGHAYFAKGDFSQAEAEYRVALKIEPSNGTTHADLAGALLREDKKPEATQEASQAISLGERNHWVYKELAIPAK